jgi:hypothetical protein
VAGGEITCQRDAHVEVFDLVRFAVLSGPGDTDDMGLGLAVLGVTKDDVQLKSLGMSCSRMDSIEEARGDDRLSLRS